MHPARLLALELNDQILDLQWQLIRLAIRSSTAIGEPPLGRNELDSGKVGAVTLHVARE